ncbi:MAG TPA: hypothetical protein PLJ60_16795 [Chryseolinea sp.]|nr:hypothetical protein [Chryseolinea sp.]HPM31993.1 hypothetical protein [Chryseolinea sp.]
MKFLIQIITIILLCFILELFLPWYCIAMGAFAMGYLLRSKANFLAGFLAIALLWFTKAWLMDASSTTELADKVAHIFPLGHKAYLFLLTSVLGGLVGGFASLTGSLLRKDKKKSSTTLTF